MRGVACLALGVIFLLLLGEFGIHLLREFIWSGGFFVVGEFQ